MEGKGESLEGESPTLRLKHSVFSRNFILFKTFVKFFNALFSLIFPKYYVSQQRFYIGFLYNIFEARPELTISLERLDNFNQNLVKN